MTREATGSTGHFDFDAPSRIESFVVDLTVLTDIVLVMTISTVPATDTQLTADQHIGRVFRHLMWDQGVTQLDIARAIGHRSHAGVAKKLRGKSAWSAQEIVTVCALLKTTPADVLAGVDPWCAIRDLNPEPAD